MCIVLAAVYSGNLVAFMSVYKVTGLAETIQDLADLDYDVGVDKGTSVVDLFKVTVFTEHCYNIFDPLLSFS